MPSNRLYERLARREQARNYPSYPHSVTIRDDASDGDGFDDVLADKPAQYIPADAKAPGAFQSEGNQLDRILVAGWFATNGKPIIKPQMRAILTMKDALTGAETTLRFIIQSCAPANDGLTATLLTVTQGFGAS